MEPKRLRRTKRGLEVLSTLALMWSLIDSELRHWFRGHRGVQELLAELTRSVVRGEVTFFAAAHALLDRMKH